TMSASQPATSVVDASTGRILYRRSLASDADTATDSQAGATPATGIAYRYFPGHMPRGGTADPVNFTKLGWLSSQARILSGNNSPASSAGSYAKFANRAGGVPPPSPHRWDYRPVPSPLKHVSFCDTPSPCPGSPKKPFSWRVNRRQNTTQVFFFVNN